MRTTRGSIIPLARIDWASSSNRLSSKSLRGCSGFGWMASTGIWSADSCGSHGAGDGMGAGCWMWVRVGSSAPIPLPSARRGCSDLLMVENLFGESNIAFRPLGSGVIGQDGFAETGRFGQANAAGDDGAEDLVLEELAQVGGHLAGEVGPVVVHGEEDAFDGEGVLEAFANPVDGVHEFRYSFQGEEFALDGDQDGMGGDQRIEGEQVESWGAIDQNEAVGVADLGQALAEGVLAMGDVDEFQVGADQGLVGGDDVQAFESGGADGVPGVGVAQQDVVEAGFVGVLGDTETAGGIALWVGVHHQDPYVVGCQGSGEVDGGRGFPDAALLVGNSEDSAQAFRLACCFT